MGHWFIERLEEFADREAVIQAGRIVSYGELLEEQKVWKTRLREADARSARVVALVSEASISSCACFLALIEEGHVALPLTPGTHVNHPEFLDIGEAQLLLEPDITTEVKHLCDQAVHPLTRSLLDERRPGLLLFSSGSTGKSKAALHALDPLLEKFQRRRDALRTIVFLLLDHIGGVNTLFYVLSNGGTLIMPSGRSPRDVCRTIETSRAELLPVSPTFLNLLLLSEAHREHDLSSLKKITYGTETMPQSTLEQLNRAFPDVSFQQTYGLSELGILRSKSRDRDSLWVKVGGESFETKIVENTLWIRAQSAMLGYLNAPSPFDDEGWFNTGDSVEVDGEYIKILGRDSEIINVGGEKVYPAEVESRILELDNIKDVVVFGEPSALTGQIVVASVNLLEAEPHRDLKKRVRKALRQGLAPFKIPQKILVSDDAQFNERFKRMRLERQRNDLPG